jgi:hypothetical protein
MNKMWHLHGRPCATCQARHVSCDRGRPCSRCVEAGEGHRCTDPPQRPRKRGRPSSTPVRDEAASFSSYSYSIPFAASATTTAAAMPVGGVLLPSPLGPLRPAKMARQLPAESPLSPAGTLLVVEQ